MVETVVDTEDADTADTTNVASLPGCVLGSILYRLDPGSLARCGAVCRAWRSLATAEDGGRLWRRHYGWRWKTDHLTEGAGWSKRYGSKMDALKCWGGRYSTENHYGHKAGVRCCKLLSSLNLMATGSQDKTVRLWSLNEHGANMLSVSKAHGGIVRSLAMDTSAVVSGSSDNMVRVWASRPPVQPSSSSTQPLFDVSAAPDIILREHKGPVAAMCMNSDLLFTGSWDYTVRVWERAKWEGGSKHVWMYDDWVSAVAARGPNLLVAAGAEVYVHDIATGAVVRKFQGLHEGQVTCVEGSMNGRMLFTGAGDGLVMAHDLRMRDPSCFMWHHSGTVHSLSYEDPWLVSAAADGSVVLINTETQLLARQQQSAALQPRGSGSAASASVRALSATCRALHNPHSGALYCVDMVDQRIVTGSESGVVSLFDFRGAADAAVRATTAREGRKAARAAKRERWQQQQHKRHHQDRPPQPPPTYHEATAHAVRPAAKPACQPLPQLQPQPSHPHQQWRVVAGHAEGNGGRYARAAVGGMHNSGGRFKKVQTPHVPLPSGRAPAAAFPQQMVALNQSSTKPRSHGANSNNSRHN